MNRRQQRRQSGIWSPGGTAFDAGPL